MRPSISMYYNSVRLFCGSSSGVFKIGDILKQSRKFTSLDIEEYSKLTRDFNPLHFDLECAKTSGFPNVPVPGLLVASFFPRIFASHFPGAVYAKQTLEFKSPVFVDECITGVVQARNIRQVRDKFLVKFEAKCLKNDDEVVICGEATAILPTLAVAQIKQS